MSTYERPTADQLAALDRCLTQLDSALDQLRAQLRDAGSGVGGWLTDVFTDSGNTTGAAENVLGQWEGQLASLRSWKRDDVVAGEYSLEGWFGEAKAIYDEAKRERLEVGGWTFGGIVSQAWDATKQDLQDDAGAALHAVAGVVPWQVWALGAVAVWALLS